MVTNITVEAMMINKFSPDIWTILFGFIGLGGLIFGSTFLFCFKQRREVQKIFKEFKGNLFLKQLKEEIFYDYIFGTKLIFGFTLISSGFYFWGLFRIVKIFLVGNSYSSNQLATMVLLSFAFSIISVIIALALYFKKEKLVEYRDVEEVDHLPDIPSSLKSDIKKLKDRFGLLQLNDKSLAKKVIESIAQEINHRRK